MCDIESRFATIKDTYAVNTVSPAKLRLENLPDI
jgi:hypothetical protein